MSAAGDVVELGDHPRRRSTCHNRRTGESDGLAIRHVKLDALVTSKWLVQILLGLVEVKLLPKSTCLRMARFPAAGLTGSQKKWHCREVARALQFTASLYYTGRDRLRPSSVAAVVLLARHHGLHHGDHGVLESLYSVKSGSGTTVGDFAID